MRTKCVHISPGIYVRTISSFGFQLWLFEFISSTRPLMKIGEPPPLKSYLIELEPSPCPLSAFSCPGYILGLKSSGDKIWFGKTASEGLVSLLPKNQTLIQVQAGRFNYMPKGELWSGSRQFGIEDRGVGKLIEDRWMVIRTKIVRQHQGLLW